jgi:hypothetical protein
MGRWRGVRSRPGDPDRHKKCTGPSHLRVTGLSTTGQYSTDPAHDQRGVAVPGDGVRHDLQPHQPPFAVPASARSRPSTCPQARLRPRPHAGRHTRRRTALDSPVRRRRRRTARARRSPGAVERRGRLPVLAGGLTSDRATRLGASGHRVRSRSSRRGSRRARRRGRTGRRCGPGLLRGPGGGARGGLDHTAGHRGPTPADHIRTGGTAGRQGRPRRRGTGGGHAGRRPVPLPDDLPPLGGAAGQDLS